MAPETIHSLVTIDMTTILALMYLAFVATIVGYGIWVCCSGRQAYGSMAVSTIIITGAGSRSGKCSVTAG